MINTQELNDQHDQMRIDRLINCRRFRCATLIAAIGAGVVAADRSNTVVAAAGVKRFVIWNVVACC